MQSATKGMSLVQVCFRRFSQSAIRRSAASDVKEVASPRFAKLKADQKAMQIDDGVPVHIKRGAGDKILYRLTSGFVAVCMVMCAETLWKLTFKDA